MGTSDVDICNMALVELGAKTISSVEDEDTKEANTCAEVWDLVLNEVLASHVWNFAKKWDTLTDINDYDFVDSEYDYAYQLPADFVRISRMEDLDAEYVIRENVLLTNVEDAVFEYVFRVTDTTRYPAHFIAALVGRLKIPLAAAISKRQTKKQDLYATYYNTILPMAKGSDAVSSNPSPEAKGGHTESNDPWLGAR